MNGQGRPASSSARLLTETQRGLIEVKLQNMEAGRFQEFMLKFLPALDARYEGIVRYGGTEFGKTKPGVPDLIKTLENGDEIAVECGTEQGYWTPPENSDDYGKKWKPASDALKCLKRLTRPVEIVLPSTRPLSQGHPSAKTQLIDFLKQHSPVRVRPVSSEDVAAWFEGNTFTPKGQELLRQFFPEVFDSIDSSSRNEVLEATLRHSEHIGLPVGLIQKIVESNPTLSDAEVSGLVQEQLGYDSSRFRLAVRGPFQGVSRVGSAPDALRRPLGRCLELLGIPKIGKSWLCQETLEAERLPGAWYLAPTHDALLPEFLDALLVDIFSEFWPRRDVIAVRRMNQLLQLSVDSARAPSQPKVFVIENAHLLGKSGLAELSEAARFLRSKGLLDSVGMVLVTNKRIASQMNAIDETCVAPIWTREQLLRLLEQQKVAISAPDPEKYGDLLSSMSGGHPLSALSLARRYPSGAALVTAMASQAKPDPQDVDLSNELKNALYQDILTTPDKQNLVQRLSLLIGRADARVLEWLRLKVQPPIQASVDVLFDEIGGAVLDGDPKTGLAVSPAFKKVASKRMSQEENRAVYRVLAAELFRPVNRTFDAASLIDSAFYSMLAGDLEKVFACASFLLFGISKKKPDAAVIKAVLNRLDFLQWVKVPDEDEGARLSYYSYLTAACYYSGLAKDPSLGEVSLENVDLEWLRTHQFEAREYAKMAHHLREAVLGQRVLRIHKDKDPLTVLGAYLDAIAGPKPPEMLSMLLDILPILISKISPSQLTRLDPIRLVDVLGAKDISALAELALLLGHEAHEKPELASLIDRPKGADARRELFFGLAHAYRTFSSGNHAEASMLLDVVEKDAAGLGITAEQMGAAFLQFKGDIYFELKDAPTAVATYQKSNAIADKWDVTVPSWNHFRMGLIAPDVDAAVAELDVSAGLFAKQGNDRWSSRALGASATMLLKAKRYDAALERAEKLALLFHREGKEVGAALRLLTSQVLRLQSDLSGQPLPDKLTDFPGLDARPYLHVSDDLKIESGGASTFYCLASFASTLGLHGRALALFRRAFEFDGKPPVDRSARLMNILSFLDELEPEDVDWAELRRLMPLMLPDRPNPGDREETFFYECLLRPFRQKASQDPAKWGSVALRFLSELSDVLRGQPQEHQGQWDIRINLARAEVYAAMKARQEAAEYSKEAFDAAVRDGHSALAVEAGGHLSFTFIEASGSLKELAERQRDTLYALARAPFQDEQLRNFGINMLRCWRSLKWRRLVASDLRTKGLLQDGAIALYQASTDEGEAGAVMLALLSRVFNDGDVPQLPFAADKLPEEVRRLLSF